jgi:hypothetical protein
MEAHTTNPIDVLQARVSQATAAANLLLALYSQRDINDTDHVLSPQDLTNSVWAIVELLEQASEASDAYTKRGP